MSATEQTLDEPSTEHTGENAMLSHGETVFMQTAQTEIQNPKSTASMTTRIMLDCGSQRTYITQALVNKLGLKKEHDKERRVYTFGGEEAKVLKTQVTTVNLKLKNGQYMRLQANMVPVISGHVRRSALNAENMNNLRELANSLNLADCLPDGTETSQIDLLIGNDHYLDVVLQQRIEVQPGLYLCSKLGWILTWRTPSTIKDMIMPNMLILTQGSVYENTSTLCSVDSALAPVRELEDFWKVEAIGICDKET